MTIRIMRTLFAGACASLAMALADNPGAAETLLGEAVDMGEGMARAYVELDADARPTAWQTAGYYPAEYCIRYVPESAAYTVSLEGLLERRPG